MRGKGAGVRGRGTTARAARRAAAVSAAGAAGVATRASALRAADLAASAIAAAVATRRATARTAAGLGSSSADPGVRSPGSHASARSAAGMECPTSALWPAAPGDVAATRASFRSAYVGNVSGFALAFLGIFAAVYFWVQRSGHTNVAEKAGLANPANPSEQKVTNPLQKYVEVVGIRMMSENKKPVAKFVVVNHSNAEISGLQANVTLWASTSRSEEDSVGSFSFRIGNLQPSGSQELTEPLKTKLKAYELPDWQNATAEIQIVAPQP